MNTLILYPRTAGNTYEICSYIKNESSIKTERIIESSSISTEGIDNVILCSGVYGGHVHKNIIKWIESRTTLKDIKIHLLLTWIGRGKSNHTAFKEIKKTVRLKDGELSDNFFSCFGKGFGIIRKSHPDKKDMENALAWIRKIDSPLDNL